MSSATIHEPETSDEESLLADPRWELVNRIATSEPFQKSTRLPNLLLYLARHTIAGERNKLTEHTIGQAVFGKQRYFDPAEDSSVRVNVRQLRLKLHEYYQAPGLCEDMVVSLPKGGYALDFSQRSSMPAISTLPLTAVLQTKKRYGKILLGSSWVLLLVATVVCAIGWRRAVLAHESATPWPLSAVLHRGSSTTLVIADVGTSLRMLGNHELTLDSYIDHSYLQQLLPKHMTEEEASLFHYLDSTRITSEADANGAAILSSVAGQLSENLKVRSARDINANDLTQGDFIFLGAKSSNPWVQLAESRMNFQLFEDGPHGARYIINRHPQAGEQRIYQSTTLGSLTSGEDYGVIALLPAKTGNGNWLLMEGERMQGTNAALRLIKTPEGRSKLETKLASINNGQPPKYFEALIHAQSVAGATMTVDIVAVRSFQP
jgi:hypothetical protein